MISVPSETHGATVVPDGVPLWAWASLFFGRPCRPAGFSTHGMCQMRKVSRGSWRVRSLVLTVVLRQGMSLFAQRASTPYGGTWQPSERLFDITHRFGMVVTCTLVQKMSDMPIDAPAQHWRPGQGICHLQLQRRCSWQGWPAGTRARTSCIHSCFGPPAGHPVEEQLLESPSSDPWLRFATRHEPARTSHGSGSLRGFFTLTSVMAFAAVSRHSCYS